MMTVVIGGASSGKSEYAEGHVLRLDGERVYLATMEPFGREAAARIERHRKRRENRGFRTVECPRDLASLSGLADANVLLEDLPNLMANEMFAPGGGGKDAVLAGIRHLQKVTRHLTIVTGDLTSDGIRYPEETDRYLRDLGEVAIAAAAEADLVVEVVCGLPNILRGSGTFKK